MRAGLLQSLRARRLSRRRLLIGGGAAGLTLAPVVRALRAQEPAQGQGISPQSGFAGLGASGDGYDRVTQRRPIRFPEDHGAHPGYRIEWWYVTANLTAADGRVFGLQWTLFRQATRPPAAARETSGGGSWRNPDQFWLGHAALSDATRHRAAELLARGGVGQAGARAAPFEAFIDDWLFAEAPGGPPSALGLGALRLRARGAGDGGGGAVVRSARS